MMQREVLTFPVLEVCSAPIFKALHAELTTEGSMETFLTGIWVSPYKGGY